MTATPRKISEMPPATVIADSDLLPIVDVSESAISSKNKKVTVAQILASLPDGAITSAKIADGAIVDADVNASAAIADTKLATIATAGKVSNSATTATNANTASAIVARDGSGNFSAGTITAALAGNASTVTTNANLTGDVTSVGNATSIAAGVVVDADVSASAGIVASKLSFTQAGTGAVARTVDSKLKDAVSVKDFGAVGDGVADDTAAIQAAINSGAKSVVFPAGVYSTSSQLTLAANQSLQGHGAEVTSIIAKASTDFQYVAYHTGGANIRIFGITFDANQANRAGVLTTTAIPLLLADVTNCRVSECTFQNALGTTSAPGFGMAIGGASNRCTIHNCFALNNGTASKPADGFFCSASDSLISNCIASQCADTAFVIESASRSGIVGCVSHGCSCGGAITNAINTDVYGNYINGLSVYNWNATVTGGIQIGTPLSTSTGGMYDTLVNGVVICAEVSAGFGTGCAINIRTTGTPKPARVIVSNCVIDGATLQGVLATSCVSCSIINNSIKQTGAAAIQFAGGTGHVAQGNVIDTTSFGIIATLDTKLTAQGNTCSNVTHGTYAFDASTLNSYHNTVYNPTIAYHGKDAGATLNVLGQVADGLLVGNPSGSAPVGTMVNKFVVYDRTGNSIGYVPIYGS